MLFRSAAGEGLDVGATATSVGGSTGAGASGTTGATVSVILRIASRGRDEGDGKAGRKHALSGSSHGRSRRQVAPSFLCGRLTTNPAFVSRPTTCRSVFLLRTARPSPPSASPTPPRRARRARTARRKNVVRRRRRRRSRYRRVHHGRFFPRYDSLSFRGERAPADWPRPLQDRLKVRPPQPLVELVPLNRFTELTSPISLMQPRSGEAARAVVRSERAARRRRAAAARRWAAGERQVDWAAAGRQERVGLDARRGAVQGAQRDRGRGRRRVPAQVRRLRGPSICLCERRADGDLDHAASHPCLCGRTS